MKTMSVTIVLARSFAHSYGPASCPHGYIDGTNGHAYNWTCARSCIAGAFWSDACCMCACVFPGNENPLVQRPSVADCSLARAWRQQAPFAPVSATVAITELYPIPVQWKLRGISDAGGRKLRKLREDEGGIPIGVKILFGALVFGAFLVLCGAFGVAIGPRVIRCCGCCKRGTPLGESGQDHPVAKDLSQVQPEVEEATAQAVANEENLETEVSSFPPTETDTQEPLRRVTVLSTLNFPPPPPRTSQKGLLSRSVSSTSSFQQTGSVRSTPPGLAHHSWEGHQPMVVGCGAYVEEWAMKNAKENSLNKGKSSTTIGG